jgi:DNA/RNA endonuclease YhcR with UshA esterase domain
LNLDEPYPSQIFTIVIWGSERAKFGEPETKYRDRRVCAKGVIKSYRGTPEIEASEPSEIEIQK